jgi:hypothetical protein
MPNPMAAAASSATFVPVVPVLKSAAPTGNIASAGPVLKSAVPQEAPTRQYTGSYLPATIQGRPVIVPAAAPGSTQPDGSPWDTMVVDNAAQSPVVAVAVAVEEAPGIPWDGLNAGEHPEFFTNYPAGTVPKGASPAAVPITPPGADVHIVSGEVGSMELSEPDVTMGDPKEEEE